MLTISREVPVKIGKIAWGDSAWGTTGFLLGKSSEASIYAALPCYRYPATSDDNWNDLNRNWPLAADLSMEFNLEIVGTYIIDSAITCPPKPTQEIAFEGTTHLIMVYKMICCPQCSSFLIMRDQLILKRNLNYILAPGIRIDPRINQKRIHQKWRAANQFRHDEMLKTCPKPAQPK